MLQQILIGSAESTWQPPSIEELPDDWNQFDYIGVDTETRDDKLKLIGPGGGRHDGSYLVGVSLAFRNSKHDIKSYYLPIRHYSGGNMPVDSTLSYLRNKAAEYKGNIAGARLAYDLDILGSENITFPNVAFFRDVQIAAPLLYELHNSYALDAILAREKLPLKDETLLKQAAADYGVDPKAEMWKLHSKFIGHYAMRDAVAPLELIERLHPKIMQKKVREVYDLECKLLPVLVYMTRRGIRIDFDRLDKIETWAISEEQEKLTEIKKHTGILLSSDDLNKTAALVPIIKSIGVEPGTAPKTGKASIDADLLQSIDHPVAQLLLRAKKLNKLRTTFVASIRKHELNGRIHSHYNQLRMPKGDLAKESGAAYGRLSCSNPNLQQQPSRDDFAPMWRSIYLPEEGELWASNDFSQQEPRLTLHYAYSNRDAIGESAWQVARTAVEEFIQNPRTDNHTMMGRLIYGREPSKKERHEAKQIFLALCYGMGGYKLCNKLGYPTKWVVRNIGETWEERMIVYDYGTPEAEELIRVHGQKPYQAAGEEGQRIIDIFNSKVPYVKSLAKAVEKKIRRAGTVRTLAGRCCHFPLNQWGKRDWVHKGLNRLIQGGSGDQTKRAMVALYEEGYDIMIQVHDEIGLSVKAEKQAHEAARIMENVCPLAVPTVVDVEIGKSWGHSMGYQDT